MEHGLTGAEDVEIDYESLPSQPLWVTSTAGAAAGLLEHLAMYPFDSVKNTGMEHGLTGAEDVEIDYESLPSQPLWVTSTAGAAAGLLEHLAMYPFDSVKNTGMEHGLTGAEDVEIDYESLPSQPLWVTSTAGAAAGLLEHLAMYPFDSVKNTGMEHGLTGAEDVEIDYESLPSQPLWVTSTAGAAAGLLEHLAMYPFDSVKNTGMEHGLTGAEDVEIDYESLPSQPLWVTSTAGAAAGLLEHLAMYPFDSVKNTGMEHGLTGAEDVEIDYESLPSQPLWVTSTAGAAAGLLEHLAMYPFDFVKNTGMEHGLTGAEDVEIDYESLPSQPLWVTSTAGAAAGLLEHLAMYPFDSVKNTGIEHGLTGAEDVEIDYESLPSQPLWVTSTAGAAAGLLEHLAMYPFDSVKNTGMEHGLTGAEDVEIDYESLPSQPLWVTSTAGAAAGLLEHLAMYPFDSVKNTGMEHGLTGAEDVEIDYESLPSQPLWVTSTAGAAAGLLEHLAMYPFDSVKTRMQSLCPCPERKLNPVSGLWSIAMREGWWRPLRGMSAVATGAVPAHALYFSIYEKSKHWLTNGRFGHNQTASYALAGVTATVFHDAVMNPAEVVKQRMQMWGSPYQGSLQCARCIWKAEGGRAFYRSYTTQLTLNVPFQMIHFSVYEFFQEILNKKREYNPSSHVTAGACAGAIAGALTTPLDVVKTVLNTQQSATVNFVEAANSPHQTVYGLFGFFSGAQARVLVQTPATAVSWSVYEFANPKSTPSLTPDAEKMIETL